MTEQNKNHEVSAAFGNSYRRGVILSLWEEGESLNLAEVRARNNDVQNHQELLQEHLPLLEERGYIQWDRDSGTISKGPNFEEAIRQIEILNQQELEEKTLQN